MKTFSYHPASSRGIQRERLSEGARAHAGGEEDEARATYLPVLFRVLLCHLDSD